ncbi:MAG: hypothetical protein KIT45_11855 [Fimbriimonadia bacterium]|nr:hypothetical protein [Fimbriimonadia bacterium]
MQLKTVQEWEALFKPEWQKEHARDFDKWSKDNNSFWFYYLAYGIDGLTAMYEATQETAYLDQAIDYLTRVRESARPSSTIPTSQFRDTYLGWAAFYQESVKGTEIPLYETYLWRYVMKLLRVINDSPSARNQRKYRSFYEEMLAFSESHMFDKWHKRGVNNFYRERTHMAAHSAYIAMIMERLTSDNSRKRRCRDVYNRINRDLRSQMIPNPRNSAAVYWDSVWGKKTGPGQDTSHGNNVVAYIVEAYDLGVFWTKSDVDSLVSLFLKVLWNGSETRPAFAGMCDGSEMGKGTFLADGYVKLGRYSREARQVLETFQHPGYLTQYYGNCALNAKRLRG